MTSLPASDWIIMITKQEQFAPRWMFIPYLWSSLLWHDFSSPLLSAARKSDATMQKTCVRLIDSEASLDVYWYPVLSKILLCITIPRLRNHNSFVYLYLLCLRVILLNGAPRWIRDLDYHYLLALACSFFLGTKSNAFITIGWMMKRN